ncbi:MAG: 30S ribosomal protein S16 [Chloroflexota bacterium]
MVRIRLRRVGAKKKPSYRIVVADSRAPRNGAFVEVIGQYDPRTDPPTVKVDAEKAARWLKTGAQPSNTVALLFKKAGLEKG